MTRYIYKPGYAIGVAILGENTYGRRGTSIEELLTRYRWNVFCVCPIVFRCTMPAAVQAMGLFVEFDYYTRFFTIRVCVR